MLFGFGNTVDGQLGVGAAVDNGHILSPILVVTTGSFPENAEVASIVCGGHHTLILLADGSVYSCGNNDVGQLGHDGPRKKLGRIHGLAAYKVARVACGSSHSLALTKDGNLFSWGSNEFNQLGIGMAIENSFSVKRIALSNVVDIASGSWHSLALLSDGRLYSWGRNDDHQLGLGYNQNIDVPHEITSLYGIAFHTISCGSCHTVILSTSGTVFAWGQNKHGQLGVGDVENRAFPVQIKSLRSAFIVRIACGSYHTVALTKDGRLFTFGAGTYGQLGHNSKNNESTPKQVFDLTGLTVKSTVCGRCHTLTLVGNKLYAFGLNGSGQLGLGDVQSRLVPIASQLDKIISEVYAGGDHSFIICTSKDDIEVDHVESPIYDLLDQKCVAHLTLERLKHVLCKSVPHVLDELKLVLSNTPCLNGSFLKKDFKNYFTGRKNSGVDMDDVMEGFQLLNESAHSETFTKTMQDCIERHLIPKFRSSPPPDVEALRLFVILPWCPAFSCIERYRTLHMPFVSALLNLKPLPLEVIESWWSLFELRHFNRVLKVNSSTKKLPLDSFYVNELAEKVEIRQDYYLHINNPSDERFSFCNYPFIFNAGVKTLLLETDALLTQQTQMQQAHFNTFLMQLGLAPQNFPYLVLTVSRNNLVQDTINQLLSFPPNDLKKPLKVVFRGEEADDAGGVRKEFFMLLLTELLQPKYGMFVEYTESRKLWFAPHLFENDDVGMYKLIGILCGLAIYNGIIVALPFPLALYKKLLDQPTVLEDLKDLSPTEGRSLESLMDYDNDDFEDVFSLYFQVSIDIFGTSKTVDLKPDGGSLSVTKSNRQEYIDLYVDRKLNTSIADQFNAFKEGFHKAVASRILRFFQPIELMEMAVGNEQYDWYLFEKETVYKGDYWRYHPVIKMFWNVFHSLTLDQKKKFLLFLTGSDRVPLLGMKKIKIVIQPTSSGEQYYPVAHTCFNLLDLPRYSDEEVLRQRLLDAIEHNQGFALV